MTRYAMAIDLSRCAGCCGCMMACKLEHGTPPGISWPRVLVKEQGEYPAVTKSITPVQCNHCRDAACVKVCPTGATSQREDGIVFIDYDKCVGCRYCMMACPYGARYYRAKVESYFPGGLQPFEKVGQRNLQVGVVMKCTFCLEKIDEGLQQGLKPGVDRAATPSCVINCIARARYFGDLDDPASEVSQVIRASRGTQLHEEFGTNPSVYYLR